MNKTTCDLCTRSNQIQRERIASGKHLSKQADWMVSRSNKILRPNDIGDYISPYQYPASTDDVAIHGIFYA